jgi:hypothetical protein
VAPCAFRKIPDEPSPFSVARPFDCFGAYRGTTLCIEAKHYGGFPVPLSILKKHQAAALVEFDEALGDTPHFCGVALRVGDTRALIPIAEWVRRRRGSYTEALLEPYRVIQVPFGKKLRWGWPDKALALSVKG